MSFSEHCSQVFNQAIRDYHIKDNIDTPINNPYDRDDVENRLYLKCWIDTVQWHFEDIIRDPHIDPVEALALMPISVRNIATSPFSPTHASTPRARHGPWTV